VTAAVVVDGECAFQLIRETLRRAAVCAVSVRRVPAGERGPERVEQEIAFVHLRGGDESGLAHDECVVIRAPEG
jgi:hypothetical protein